MRPILLSLQSQENRHCQLSSTADGEKNIITIHRLKYIWLYDHNCLLSYSVDVIPGLCKIIINYRFCDSTKHCDLIDCIVINFYTDFVIL